MRVLQILEELAQLFALFVGEFNEAEPKADGPHLMRDFAGQIEQTAIRKVHAEGEHFAGMSFAGRIDETASFRQIGDTCGTVPVPVPNGFERNIQTLLAATVVHIQCWDLGTAFGQD